MWICAGTLLLLSSLVDALLVVPSSPQCASLCGNTLSSTSGGEISCSDSDYTSSTYGAAFKACISCELSSPYYDTATKQADLRWAIFNLRYALSWCLFGFGNNTKIANTPCLTSFSCGPLFSAIEFDGLNPNASTYSYCPIFQTNEASVSSCTGCIRQTGNVNFLANFVTVLDAGCAQQPAPGGTLSLEGNVFSSTPVNITSPSSTPISSFTPHTGLDLGAKIGIAVGCIVVLLICAGFIIVCCGRRRRRKVLAAHQKATGYSDWINQGGSNHSPYPGTRPTIQTQQFFDSPASQRPLRRALSWEQSHSPETAQAEKAYFSPYSSQYSSPVSALDQRPVKAAPWPVDGKMMQEIELGPVFDTKDPRGPGWAQNPAPVLQHPGLGRGHYDPNEDMDIRRATMV